MSVLLLFMDGVGLGANDPSANPLALAHMPNLRALLDGHPLTAAAPLPLENQRASLLPIDACMGVDGRPQSATGQAALLSGRNIPAALGFHDGPKPSPEIINMLRSGTIFHHLQAAGRSASLLNAYPPRYFSAIESGRRLPGTIALAARLAGIPLKTQADLFSGKALSADFTAQGWHEHLGITDTPRITPVEAGKRLASLALSYDFAIFEYWLSDIAGHRQEMEQACALLETFDEVLGGLLASWQDEHGLILITSDHGNLEDLTTRRHTTNPVPALLFGAPATRHIFIQQLHKISPSGSIQPDRHPSLAQIMPAILAVLGLTSFRQ
ncbi:MAG: hypothetical protein JW726_05345 [Anaerolineales bacterium]|nr:hypothetical protein [Anaerolineales bacterium]